jgi:ribonuclease Z
MVRSARRPLAVLASLAGVAVAFAAPAQPVGLVAGFFEKGVEARLKAPLSRTDLFDATALRVVLCGTGSPMPDPARARACTAVIVKGKAYLVDTGPGSVNTLQLMGFPLDRIAGVFLTHYHSDHIGDLGELRMQTWVSGRTGPLPVYGPEGVARVVGGFNAAYALDDDYRTVHHGESYMPHAAAALAAHSFDIGEAGDRVVYKDADVTITAFAVNHDPIKPAVGYRFESGGRSIVVSGDTAPSPNLVKWSHGADVLVHEALSTRMVGIISRASTAAGLDRQAKMVKDTLNYHTDPVDSAKEANAAGVGLLVYSHLAPGLPQPALEKLFIDGVAAVRDPKAWVVGFDGLRVDLPYAGGAPTQSKVAMLGR